MLSTSIPVSVGGSIGLDLPGRFRLQIEAGVMPSAYVDLVNELANVVGAYGPSQASLVRSTMADAAVVRIMAGWRPAKKAGLEFYAGYSGIFATRGRLDADQIQTITGRDIGNFGRSSLGVQSSVHAVYLRAGWRILITDHLIVRLGIGLSVVTGTDTTVETVPGVPDAIVEEVTTSVADKILEVGVLPDVSLAIGLRL